MKNELKKRNIPDVLANVQTLADWEKKRDQIKILLQQEEYGFLPPKPDRIEFEEKTVLKDFGAGKADLKSITITAYFGEEKFSFPIYSTVPKKGESIPAIVQINFRPDVPDRYLPSEELLDHGFAVFSFCYTDVTSDDGDFTSGLAGVLFENSLRSETDAGKLMLWAWAAMRLLDYIETLPNIDKTKISICGHSRLGKTALVAGAFDERFACAFSNDSGCSGAALSREKIGEDLDTICRVFPFWFCENYGAYRKKEASLPFDQHFLIALLAPRRAYIASAELDDWADPRSEQLAALAASPAWKLYEKEGLLCNECFAKAGEYFHKGAIGYHLRQGTHYFSREDWLFFMHFWKNKDSHRLS